MLRYSKIGVTMTDNWQDEITKVLQSTHIAFLSTQASNTPETSMTPFAIFEDKLLLHLSGLARHSKNIQAHAEVGLMICTPEQPEQSPLALPRISFNGTITPVADEQLQHATKTYLARIPDAEPLFSFADFTLYQLNVNEVYWVGGFGSARKVSTESWRKLCC